MDEALRACERALAMGGRSPVELLKLRVRAGRVDRRRVEAAARIGSQAACEALGRQVRREARLPALLVSARDAAGEAGRAWAVSAVAEWLVARPGEVLAPADVLVAVAAVRARCKEPEHPKHVGRVAALERASAELIAPLGK